MRQGFYRSRGQTRLRLQQTEFEREDKGQRQDNALSLLFAFYISLRSELYRKMKGILILILALASLSQVSEGNRFASRSFISQKTDTLKIWDKLDIQSDPRLKTLLQQHVNQNKKNNTTSGYRLQIYFGSGSNAHNEAMKIRTDFLSSHPEVKAYLVFKSPDFKVLVGDFRTKNEALKLQKSLVNQYPNAFIVADEIAFPAVDETK
jgi:hypothetical protein